MVINVIRELIAPAIMLSYQSLIGDSHVIINKPPLVIRTMPPNLYGLSAGV